MDRRKSLKQFVYKAKRNLNMEQMMPMLQVGVFIGLAFSAVILVLSRLFVFPYYRTVAVSVAIGVLLLTIVYIWWKRMKERDALHRLDAFYPHNELITALSFKDDRNPLVDALLTKAEEETPHAFQQFKGRKKELWKPKVLIGSLFVSILIGVLFIFPSATQQDALVYEKEQDVIQDLKKEVAKLEKKTETKEIKKELQELQNKLKEMKLSEEALREVVKKQKELKLQEQKLNDKKSLAQENNGEGSKGLTAEEQKQLEELIDLQNSLANSANSTQTALSKLGKPISFDLENAIASELGTEADAGEGSESEGSDSDGQNGENQQENNENGNGQGTGGQGNQSGSGQSGQGQGSGSGSGQGSGQGSGSGSGSGGSGAGSGSGAGLGQGSRDLLSIPERIGGSSDPTADGGPLSEGKPVAEQKGPVPVTKGTIRPYEEVIGEYKDSYLESSERMQLPKDLQDIVQSYFSSIEK